MVVYKLNQQTKMLIKEPVPETGNCHVDPGLALEKKNRVSECSRIWVFPQILSPPLIFNEALGKPVSRRCLGSRITLPQAVLSSFPPWENQYQEGRQEWQLPMSLTSFLNIIFNDFNFQWKYCCDKFIRKWINNMCQFLENKGQPLLNLDFTYI